MRHPLRRRVPGARLLPFHALGLLWPWLAEPTPASLAVGGIVAAAGGALRAWGAGHLVKTDRLAVAGPYAFLRHPLDAGTLLAVLGLGAAAAGDASGRSAERFRANDEGGALLAIAAAWPLLALRGAAA